MEKMIDEQTNVKINENYFSDSTKANWDKNQTALTTVNALRNKNYSIVVNYENIRLCEYITGTDAVTDSVTRNKTPFYRKLSTIYTLRWKLRTRKKVHVDLDTTKKSTQGRNRHRHHEIA